MEVKKGGKEYFNKRYIKEHPEHLFIFEDSLDDEEFEKYDNVFPIPTYDKKGNYFRDKYLERNKDIIREAIDDILEELKRRRYKRVVIPEKTIGKGKSKLYENQRKTYEYLKRKMNELVTEIERKYKYNHTRYSSSSYGRDIYGRDKYGRDKYGRDRYERDRYERDRYERDRYGRRLTSISSRNKSRNRRYGSRSRRMTKKELRKLKEKKKTRKIKLDSVPKAYYAQKRCNACIKFKSLLQRPLTKRKRKGEKFIAKLEKAEKKCSQCHSICQYLDQYLKPEMPNFDVYQAKYPSICLKDEDGNKRVFRLMNSYRKKLLEQYEHFDLNLEKE